MFHRRPAHPAAPRALAAAGLLLALAASADAPDEFAREILDAHNCYRAAHGVPALAWSEEIAAYAQQWIDANGYEHSPSYESPIGPMGENLYAGTRASGKAAAAKWYSEIEDPGYLFDREEPAPGTGHLTAMLWKDARYLGCGISGEVISCNYWSGKADKDCSTPNMGGCYVEQVPAPITTAACE
jgi:hypothetical protein